MKMKAFRVAPFASGLIVLILLSVACAGHAAATPARTVAGEMVVTDVSANRFRIVGHNGSYTAPAGTSIQALDGRNVNVELTAKGRVAQITEVPVHIDPITHGWATARGDLVVNDAAAGRFSFAGDSQTYVAPSAVDLRSYAGKLVEIRLDESGRVTDMQVVGSPQTSYLPPPARDLNAPNRPSRACAVGDATIASGSGICRDGTTFRCNDGAWIDSQTACR